MIREIMPPEQFRSCFQIAVERGHWLRMLHLAEEPLLDAHLLPEDFEFAVSSAIKDKIWASDLAQLISSRPSLRRRLRTLALEKAIEIRNGIYLEEVAKALSASPQEIEELRRKAEALPLAAAGAEEVVKPERRRRIFEVLRGRFYGSFYSSTSGWS